MGQRDINLAHKMDLQSIFCRMLILNCRQGRAERHVIL